ncbi:MAG: hypothetical protein GY864_14630 [Desulfobacterales bacterium]|nr:hypothetical protein [Desulfobacterales bacterium]
MALSSPQPWFKKGPYSILLFDKQLVLDGAGYGYCLDEGVRSETSRKSDVAVDHLHQVSGELQLGVDDALVSFDDLVERFHWL